MLTILTRNIGTTAVVITTLALGIGINTAIFSILNDALLKQLPISHPEQIVILTDATAAQVMEGVPQGRRVLLSYTEFRGLQQRAATLDGICAAALPLETWTAGIAGSRNEELHGRFVSDNYFFTLGVVPALGQPAGAVISHRYWQRRFNSDPAILGASLRIHNITVPITAVAAAGFHGETVGQNPDIWLPLSLQPQMNPGLDALHDNPRQKGKLMWLHVFARLKPAVTRARSQAEIDTLLPGIQLSPIRTGAFTRRDEFTEQWTILALLAALVLLIACCNVANLQLAQALGRAREVSIRFALGATSRDIIVQFLSESLLLATLGGIAGLIVAYLAAGFLSRLLTETIHPGIDFNVFTFTVTLTLSTGGLFGLIPALRAGRGNLTSVRDTSFSRALVVAQIALSLLLVTASGLFLQTLRNLQSAPLGYPAQRLLLTEVETNPAEYRGPRRLQFFRDLTTRLQSIPGVQAVTWSAPGLLTGFAGAFPVDVEGYTHHDADDQGAVADYIAPAYFTSLQIPLVLGRDIVPQDTANATRVCIINEAFAKRFFAGRSPLGKHVSAAVDISEREMGGDGPRVTMRIVGVVKDTRDRALRGPVVQHLYVPANQTGAFSGMTFEVLAQRDPAQLAAAVTRAVHGTRTRTFAALLDERNTQPLLIARLCSFFGFLAVILAAVGVAGILSNSTARRTREFGVRVALGASGSTLVRMILGETTILIAAGLFAGLAATIAAARLMATQLYGPAVPVPLWTLASYRHIDSGTRLYGITATDPLTIAIAIAFLMTVTLLAALLPAFRASQVNPVQSLRHE